MLGYQKPSKTIWKKLLTIKNNEKALNTFAFGPTSPFFGAISQHRRARASVMPGVWHEKSEAADHAETPLKAYEDVARWEALARESVGSAVGSAHICGVLCFFCHWNNNIYCLILMYLFYLFLLYDVQSFWIRSILDFHTWFLFLATIVS